MLKILTTDELDRLIHAPDWRSKAGRRDRALLLLMAHGGLRIAEACALRADDIHTDGGVTRLTFSGKGKKTRTVSLTPAAEHALQVVLTDRPGEEFVFYGENVHKAISPRGARWLFYRYRDEVGLGKDVHPHTLRHTLATMLLRATGGDIRTVQRTLGHSSPVTTMKYYDGWDSRDCDRAAAALMGAM